MKDICDFCGVIRLHDRGKWRDSGVKIRKVLEMGRLVLSAGRTKREDGGEEIKLWRDLEWDTWDSEVKCGGSFECQGLIELWRMLEWDEGGVQERSGVLVTVIYDKSNQTKGTMRTRKSNARYEHTQICTSGDVQLNPGTSFPQTTPEKSTDTHMGHEDKAYEVKNVENKDST